ncbi:MAG: aromatic ring-hydroxylating dioxygenase subunit alpha [Ilumatobacteraceae bacterium]
MTLSPARDRLIEMARRVVEHHRSGQMPLTDAITTLPAINYTDPQRWQRELDQIFHRLPLVVALTAEMRQPHAYKALDVAGMPVLLTRVEDGTVRAFVNMCSHRGSILVDEGVGTARRFTCPYHAWTYNPNGDLVGLFKSADFGDLDMSCHGLTPLPVMERSGLIWVILSPDSTFDLEPFVGEFADLIQFHRLSEMHHYGKRILAGPNWKVAFDGYVDFYHLPILHKNTFGPDMSPDAMFHQIGPHQRITGPRAMWSRLEETPEAEWQIDDLIGGVWSVFPHGSIAGFDVGEHRFYQVARLFPGASPGESVTHLDFVSLAEPTEEYRLLADKQIDFLIDVVRDEDYATGKRIQHALRTGVKKELMFGRNEGGAQHVHRWIDKVLTASDEELADLFR